MLLHNEARRLLVEEFERTHEAKRLAETFHVRIWTVYHIVEKARRNGTSDLGTIHNGMKPKLNQNDLDRIKLCIYQQPDITLAEIIDQLKLPVSAETLRRAILKMRYTYKKKTLHASEQERPRCEGNAPCLGNWTRKN